MKEYFVLVISNDINLRNSIALMLRRAGYDATATCCIDKMVKNLSTGRYQLAILDTDDADIIQTKLYTIKHSFPKLKILVLADQPLKGHAENHEHTNAQYVEKPIAPERLLDRVWMALGREYYQPQSIIGKI